MRNYEKAVSPSQPQTANEWAHQCGLLKAVVAMSPEPQEINARIEEQEGPDDADSDISRDESADEASYHAQVGDAVHDPADESAPSGSGLQQPLQQHHDDGGQPGMGQEESVEFHQPQMEQQESVEVPQPRVEEEEEPVELDQPQMEQGGPVEVPQPRMEEEEEPVELDQPQMEQEEPVEVPQPRMEQDEPVAVHDRNAGLLPEMAHPDNVLSYMRDHNNKPSRKEDLGGYRTEYERQCFNLRRTAQPVQVNWLNS
ncbi:hypothetical protein OSTOST_15828 [Ostertagia ostertagi]